MNPNRNRKYRRRKNPKPSASIFGNANINQPALLNLSTPGQLASDQTYVVIGPFQLIRRTE